MTPIALVVVICAYLFGSVSSAVLICRLYKIPDPRSSGSHNPGATNVLRLGGKKAAILVLICDMLKGAIPVYLAYYIGAEPVIIGVVAIAACLGHMYPIFFHFKGGKGVATAIGSIAPIGWDLTGMLAVTWMLIAAITKISSAAAIITALLAPFYTWLVKPQYTFPVAMLCCLVIFRHHENIKRLYEGKEPKVGGK